MSLPALIPQGTAGTISFVVGGLFFLLRVVLYLKWRGAMKDLRRFGGEDGVYRPGALCWFCHRTDAVQDAGVVLDFHKEGEHAQIQLARCDMCRIRNRFFTRTVIVLPLSAPFVMLAVIIWTEAETTLLVGAALVAVWCWHWLRLAKDATAAGRAAGAHQMCDDGWEPGFARLDRSVATR